MTERCLKVNGRHTVDLDIEKEKEMVKQETILAVIASKGVFQINPLSYRNEKTVKLLKKMIKEGKIEKQRISAGLHNYFLKGEE